MRQLAVFLVLGLSVLMVAPPVQADRKRGTKGKPKYAQVWGAVEGTVRLSHPLEPRTVLYRCPKRDKPVLSRHAEHDPKTLSLSNCLVFVKEIKQGKAWLRPMRSKGRELAITLADNAYQPRVAWCRTKTQLSFMPAAEVVARAVPGRAEDFQPHGYHHSMKNTLSGFGPSDVTVWNFFVPLDTKQPMKPGTAFVKSPGLYVLRDDCRPGMVGYVHAFRHPYVFGPTAVDGRYDIADIPPGTYTLVAWHEGLDFEPQVANGEIATYRFDAPIVLEREFTIEAGKTLTVDFTFEVPVGLRKKPAK